MKVDNDGVVEYPGELPDSMIADMENFVCLSCGSRNTHLDEPVWNDDAGLEVCCCCIVCGTEWDQLYTFSSISYLKFGLDCKERKQEPKSRQSTLFKVIS